MPQQGRLAPLLGGSFFDRLGIIRRDDAEIARIRTSPFGLFELAEVSAVDFENLAPEYTRPEAHLRPQKIVAWLEFGHLHLGYVVGLENYMGGRFVGDGGLYEIINPLVKMSLLQNYASHPGIWTDMGNHYSWLYGGGLGDSGLPLILWRKKHQVADELSVGAHDTLNSHLTLLVPSREVGQRFFHRLMDELAGSLPPELKFHYYSAWLSTRQYDDSSGPAMDSSPNRRNSRIIIDATLQEMTPERQLMATRLNIPGPNSGSILQLDLVFRGEDSYLALDQVMALLNGGIYQMLYVNSEYGILNYQSP